MKEFSIAFLGLCMEKKKKFYQRKNTYINYSVNSLNCYDSKNHLIRMNCVVPPE